MLERSRKNPKITFAWDSAVDEILDGGTGKVTGVRLKNLKTGALTERETQGVFVAIGHQPNTSLFADQLPMDAAGYLVTDGVKTPIEGCFAAGDVYDTMYRQAVTAAGMGCMAAIEAIRFIEAEESH